MITADCYNNMMPSVTKILLSLSCLVMLATFPGSYAMEKVFFTEVWPFAPNILRLSEQNPELKKVEGMVAAPISTSSIRPHTPTPALTLAQVVVSGMGNYGGGDGSSSEKSPEKIRPAEGEENSTGSQNLTKAREEEAAPTAMSAVPTSLSVALIQGAAASTGDNDGDSENPAKRLICLDPKCCKYKHVFASAQVLARHKQNVHCREKKYSCEDCAGCGYWAKSYKDVDGLKKHIVNEHPEKCVQCKDCCRMFLTQRGLHKHFVQQHKNKKN